MREIIYRDRYIIASDTKQQTADFTDACHLHYYIIFSNILRTEFLYVLPNGTAVPLIKKIFVEVILAILAIFTIYPL